MGILIALIVMAVSLYNSPFFKPEDVFERNPGLLTLTAVAFGFGAVSLFIQLFN